MAKESGINYFYGNLGLNTGSCKILYTFEEGAGTQINSISGGIRLFTGTLSSATNFWSKPGSGFFSGNSLTVANASGLDSQAFTHLFVYEKIAPHHVTIMSSLSGNSGYRFGINSCNKIFFENNTFTPINATSYNNIGTKNLIAISYLPNFLSIGYYNANSRNFEFESFNYPFNVTRSDAWTIGNSASGYIDTYMYISEFLSPNVLNGLASGFFTIPTGYTGVVNRIFTTGFTGYAQVPYVQTGVIGHTLFATAFDGVGEFTGVFPLNNVYVDITGVLGTGLRQVPLTGVTFKDYTGTLFALFDTKTGYASSFAMDKVLFLSYIDTGDRLKVGYSTKVFDDIYNKSVNVFGSGYQIPLTYSTGIMNLFMNGLALANSGWVVSGIYLNVSGANQFDKMIIDLASGGKQIISGPPFAIIYTGQEIYFNGLNMISGYDFTYNGTNITLTGTNTGISGVLSDYPIVAIPFATGFSALVTGFKFSRNTSTVYLNGLRQQNKVDYIEGSLYDKLSGNLFNNFDNTEMYSNDGDFWE